MSYNFVVEAQNQKNSGSVNNENILNFNNSDLRNAIIIGGDQINNYYLGLDSFQKRKLDSLNFTIKLLSAEISKYDALFETNEIYKDTILNLIRILSRNQRKIETLQKMNDSVMQSKKGDELVRDNLIKEYNRKLDEKWGDFWVANPNFDPNSNIQCVNMLEKTKGETYTNRYSAYSVQTPLFSGCNECVRRYPGEWQGININGVAYNFGTPAFENLTIHIPKHGPISIIDLRTMYAEYWYLVNNRVEYVDKPFEKYLAKKNGLKDTINIIEECKSQNGILILSNKSNRHIYILVDGISYSINPGELNKYKLELNPGYHQIKVYVGTDYTALGAPVYDSQIYVNKCGEHRFDYSG
ncbi:MAG: hypothetical protein JNM51_10545 [Bacteroidia bacterium]|nr:hypothetical protein [Bacteroidia bacterium]